MIYTVLVAADPNVCSWQWGIADLLATVLATMVEAL
jgi:protein-disulfide isomerase-like protein with CxxC motif